MEEGCPELLHHAHHAQALAEFRHPEEIKAFVKERLAGYKTPRHVVVVNEIYRTPSGKVDFKHTRKVALEALGLEA